MKVGLFLLKDLLKLSVNLGHDCMEDISSEPVKVSFNIFGILAYFGYCRNMSVIYLLYLSLQDSPDGISQGKTLIVNY